MRKNNKQEKEPKRMQLQHSGWVTITPLIIVLALEKKKKRKTLGK